jgi:hypothetical protein
MVNQAATRLCCDEKSFQLSLSNRVELMAPTFSKHWTRHSANEVSAALSLITAQPQLWRR